MLAASMMMIKEDEKMIMRMVILPVLLSPLGSGEHSTKNKGGSVIICQAVYKIFQGKRYILYLGKVILTASITGLDTSYMLNV